MLTDAQIVQLIAKIYVNSNVGPLDWDLFDPGNTDGICWAAQRIDGITYVILRGSVTIEDWLRDFLAITLPFSHDALGPVHPGFLIGMHELWTEIQAKTVGPWVIGGHSLGAGRACILSGIIALCGHSPLRSVRIGEPRPGYAKLGAIFKQLIPGASYRNVYQRNHDVVTSVPLTLLVERYEHPTTLIDVTCAADAQDNTVTALHHAPLYVQAVADLDVKV